MLDRPDPITHPDLPGRYFRLAKDMQAYDHYLGVGVVDLGPGAAPWSAGSSHVRPDALIEIPAPKRKAWRRTITQTTTDRTVAQTWKTRGPYTDAAACSVYSPVEEVEIDD